MSVEWTKAEQEAIRESALGPLSVVADGTSVTQRPLVETLRLLEYGDPEQRRKKKLRFTKLVPPGTA